MPHRAVCHGAEKQLALLCEVPAFSQDTNCLSAASASTLLAHSAVADVSLIKEEEQCGIIFFPNLVSYFYSGFEPPPRIFVLQWCPYFYELFALK